MIRLIDLLFLMLAIAVGMEIGLRYGSHYGKIGVVLGFILGIVATLTALFGFTKLLLAFASKCWPPFPICKKGKCSEGDYEYIEGSEDRVIFRCKCEDKYLMKQKSKFGRFINVHELFDDGSARPYMKYVKHFGILGRWTRE